MKKGHSQDQIHLPQIPQIVKRGRLHYAAINGVPHPPPYGKWLENVGETCNFDYNPP